MQYFKIGQIVQTCYVLQERDHRPNSTWSIRGVAVVDGERIDCVFKAVESHRLANELAASWLARKVGMELVVQAMLLEDVNNLVCTVAGSDYPSEKFCRGLGTHYNSAPVFTKPDYEGLSELMVNPEVHEIIVFDVLIANTDRVDKNLLKADNFVVFDHDKAFTGEDWTSSNIREKIDVTPIGIFEQNLIYANELARQKILKVAADWQNCLASLDVTELEEIATLGILSDDDVDALKYFILKRAGSLIALVQGVIDRNPECSSH